MVQGSATVAAPANRPAFPLASGTWTVCAEPAPAANAARDAVVELDAIMLCFWGVSVGLC
jgi:hypothetical protein